MVSKSKPPSHLENVVDALPTVAGAVAALTIGPLAGPVVGGGAIVGKGWVRELFNRRATETADRLETEFELHLAEDTEMAALLAANHEPTEQILLSLYRLAINTLAAAAIPTLARLLGAYSGRRPDGAFRMVGRVLQELSAEEFDFLAWYVPAVLAKTDPERVSDGIVEVGWAIHDDRIVPHAKKHSINPVDEHELKLVPVAQAAFMVLVTQGLLGRAANLRGGTSLPSGEAGRADLELLAKTLPPASTPSP